MIKIDVNEIIELGRSFERLSSELLDKHISKGAFIAGATVQKEARALVPVDTSALRLSIENSRPISTNSITSIIGPTKSYGKEIEFGRPPGTYVSAKALEGWAKRKGLNPYAVAWAIHKKGSPPQPFLFPAAENKADEIASIIGQAFDNATREALK